VSTPAGSTPIALIPKGDWCGSGFIRHPRNENRRRVCGDQEQSRGMIESVSGHENIDRSIDRGQLNGDPGALALAFCDPGVFCMTNESSITVLQSANFLLC
jgi:hypothetical protein